MRAKLQLGSEPAWDAPEPAGEAVSAAAPARRVGVLVLGMHRSGSSAMTRMLGLLGCALPNTPMPPTFYNPRGHWESQRVADFNDEVMALAGSGWDDWQPVNPRLGETLVWPQLVARARDVLRDEFGDAPLFVLKDPRLCKLTALWSEVLAAENIAPAFVLPLRNPLEVARSLAVRDGIHEHQGLLIWLRHVLEAERATRGQARVFTEFAALLNDWEEQAGRIASEVGLVWPRVSSLSAADVSEFLTPDLRHYVHDAAEISENREISPWVRQAYDVLLGWARRGERSQDYPLLDQVLQDFDQAGIGFARPMLDAAAARRRMAQVEAELADAVGQCGTLAQERDRLAGLLEDIGAERDALAAAHHSLEGERRTLSLQHDELARRFDEREGELGVVRAERDAAAAQTGALGRELEAARGGNEELRQSLAQAERSSRQHQEEVAQTRLALQQERDQATLLQTERQQRNAATEQQHHEFKQRIAALQAALDASAQRQAELNSAVAEAQDLARHHAGLHAASEHALRDTAGRLEEYCTDMARVSQIALDSETALEQVRAELDKVREQATDQARREGELQRATQARLQAADKRLSGQAAEIARLGEQTTAIARLGQVAEDREAALGAELARLRQLAADRDAALGAELARREWLQQIALAKADLPRWWVVMPAQWRRREHHRRLARSGHFDAAAYLARYPDVAAMGIDPLRHYMREGMNEGRVI